LCSQWTITELKSALRRRNEKVSGKKQDLCLRLKESLKSKKSYKPMKYVSVKLKQINIHNSLFRFYSSMYYQVPGSKLALQELESYGLSKRLLDKFKTYVELWRHLENY
jgi:hypothetical protein